MTKLEFTESIRRNIASVGDYNFINDTVEYYQNYIETAVAKGREESEVLSELGDPKLIAKSILASRNMNYTETGDEEVGEEEIPKDDRLHIRTRSGKLISLPMWLAKTAGIVIGVGAVALVGFIAINILRVIFPPLMVGVLAYLLYKFFKDNF